MRNIVSSEPPRSSTVCPAIIAKLRMLSRRTRPARRSRSPLLAERRAADRLQHEPADQHEGRVGREVVQQVDPARAVAQRVEPGGGEADRDRGRRAEHGHHEHHPEERAADPEAPGLQHDEVAAEDEHGEQPDERPLVPLVAGRHDRRDGDHGGQDHDLHTRKERHRGAPRSGGRRRRRSLERAHVGRACGPHQSERPGHDDDPQRDGEPHDHPFKVVV